MNSKLLQKITLPALAIATLSACGGGSNTATTSHLSVLNNLDTPMTSAELATEIASVAPVTGTLNAANLPTTGSATLTGYTRLNTKVKHSPTEPHDVYLFGKTTVTADFNKSSLSIKSNSFKEYNYSIQNPGAITESDLHDIKGGQMSGELTYDNNGGFTGKYSGELYTSTKTVTVASEDNGLTGRIGVVGGKVGLTADIEINKDGGILQTGRDRRGSTVDGIILAIGDLPI